MTTGISMKCGEVKVKFRKKTRKFWAIDCPKIVRQTQKPYVANLRVVTNPKMNQ